MGTAKDFAPKTLAQFWSRSCDLLINRKVPAEQSLAEKRGHGGGPIINANASHGC